MIMAFTPNNKSSMGETSVFTYEVKTAGGAGVTMGRTFKLAFALIF